MVYAKYLAQGTSQELVANLHELGLDDDFLSFLSKARETKENPKLDFIIFKGHQQEVMTTQRTGESICKPSI